MTTLSRSIFREYDIRGIAGKDLTEDVARKVGRAYAAFLRQKGVTNGPVALGRDNRPSGEYLHKELLEGLLESGLDVIDIGIVPTPLAYWAQSTLNVAGGIQITGSHNPPEYNGFKLGLAKRSIYGDDIQSIYQIAAVDDLSDSGTLKSASENSDPSSYPPPGKKSDLSTSASQDSPTKRGSYTEHPVIDDYVTDVVARTGKIDRPLRIVVDSGNGAGALVAPKLFKALGVETKCLFCESDGTFPNHHPDPTVPENIADLIAEVKAGGYDLGVAFDGDADRIGLVDHTGDIIWGDYMLILYARDVLSRTGKGQSIIYDVKCSQALGDAISAAGGIPVMWKTGHSLIEEKMHETKAPIAGEMSGHMFFAEDWYGFDDALYGAARILKIMNNTSSSLRGLLEDVPRFVSTPEIRVDCPDDIKFGIVDQAISYFKSKYDTIDVDGVRIVYPDGWGLIRASNTQPVIVLRFEASNQSRLSEIRSEVEGWLRDHGVAV